MRHVITAFPAVGSADLQAALPIPRSDLAAEWTYVESRLVGAAAPTAVLHGSGEATVPWDLGLLQTLSRRLGGWTVGMLADRHQDEYGYAVFYAGAAVEGRTWRGASERWRCGLGSDQLPVPNDERVWASVATLYRAISGGHESELRLTDDAVGQRLAIVANPTDAPLGSLGVRRAAFIDVDTVRLTPVLTALGPAASRWRLSECRAPITGAAVAILDGDFDDAVFTALARRLEAAATAVEIGPDADGGFNWCEVRPESPVRAGFDRGAAALADIWGGLTLQIGEPAAILRSCFPPDDDATCG